MTSKSENESGKTRVSNTPVPAHPIATAEQIALELEAVALLRHPRVQQAKAKIARYWMDRVGPDDELKARFDREFEQAAFCGALNTLNMDPLRPKIHAFCRFPHRQSGQLIPGTKAGHPNPDYVYRFIPVDERSHYVINGVASAHPPAAFELGVIDQNQVYVGTISAHQLDIGPDNRFTISIDPEPAGGRRNHIQSKPGACQVIVRDILGDVATDRPHALSVERVGGAAAGIIDDAPELRYEAVLKKFVDELNAATAMLIGDRPVNRFSSPAFNDDGAYLVTQAYSPGRYRLTDDEALVVNLTLGNAAYAVVPISNEWGGINDFLNHIGCLGTGRAQPNPDGSFTFVVSLRDPGVANWVDPDGLHEGVLCIRWAGFDPSRRSDPRPSLATRLVQWHELDAALPDGCPRLDAVGRNAQLERHRAAYLGLMGDA